MFQKGGVLLRDLREGGGLLIQPWGYYKSLKDTFTYKHQQLNAEHVECQGESVQQARHVR